ncbi:hypothetical protein V2O64_16715 [Verrucomicrobiaceae bacterium 227]
MTATGAVQAGDFGPEHTLDGLTIEGWQDGTPAHPGGTRPGGHQGNHWISGDITAVNNAITASVTYNLGTSFDLSEIRILNTSNNLPPTPISTPSPPALNLPSNKPVNGSATGSSIPHTKTHPASSPSDSSNSRKSNPTTRVRDLPSSISPPNSSPTSPPGTTI